MERVPILGLGNVLLVSIQIDLQDRTALALQEDLSDRIVEIGAHGVIIDISALEIVDSFIGRMLSTVAAISNVLDAETVVVGMRPAVAITLVELGLSLGGVRTALNVERALAIIEASDRRRATDAADRGDDQPEGLTPDGSGTVRDDVRT
jgi:rsbT antagonist protein RsbS